MSADSPRRSSGSAPRGVMAIPAIVPPQVVSDRSILDSAIGFINEVTLAHQPPLDPKDTITWARFETTADISDSRFGEDWELEGNVAPPLLLILGYGLGVQVWAIPANGEAVEVLSWRHGIVSALRVLPSPLSIVADEENGRADEPVDAFGDKRPLIALVDGSSSPGSQPQFCAVNFISLKTGAQVKTIKFKNPVIDILANRSSVAVTFHERIAVFDARTLEDRLSITTCYPSPGINPNPAALGPRWLAYAENKLLHTKRSGGGCDGDGVASYTATVLNASKSLVKGLRELGEQVAAGLTGTSGSAGNSKNTSFDSGCGLDTKQAGVVTIIDIKNTLRDYSPTSGVAKSNNHTGSTDAIIAHFIAHSEALVAMEFDNSGMLLVTADRRGHDFHVFRIQPNPVGSSLAAVHHLYILHRGDTTAKVQNITLTLDSRWVAVSTLRGTTHVFPITPYGGTMGVRTHTSLHVVNKLSRFHRSAGLSGEGRSNSPISHSESTTFSQSLQPYYNSTLPPFPRPTVVVPLAQLRQPFALGSPPGSASLAGVKSVGTAGSGSHRQRLSSLSDESGKPLSVCAIFAKSRSWLLDPPNVTREAPHRIQRKAVDSLFVMAGHGALIQYDLGTKLAPNVAKEKICDDTPIELEVEAKAQWNLGRRKEGSIEIMPPLSSDNWLIRKRNSCVLTDSTRQYDELDEKSESWLAQVEIITHAGPHRRLWMGPQFVFKTYNTPSGSNLNHVDIEAVEIGTIKPGSNSSSEKLDHSTPLNMPLTAGGRSGVVPVLIESGSYSSIEQSPKLMDRFRHDHLDSDYSVAHGDTRLKEDLADAMRESPSTAASSKDAGGHVCESASSSDNVAFYDALTAEDDQVYVQAHLASAAALANVLPNIHSYDNSSSYESLCLAKKPKSSIEKIVNPLGTVTTITSCLTAGVKTDILDEVVSQLAAEDTIIHENCDESLFRPVVAIFCDEKTLLQNEEEVRKNCEKYQPPENISNKLVVPVIAKDLNDELSKREKEKNSAIKSKKPVSKAKTTTEKHFEEMSFLNKKPEEYKKANNAILSTCAGKQGSENISHKDRSSASIHEAQDSLLLEDTSKNKETPDEFKMTNKRKTKKESPIQEKHLKESQDQTVEKKSDIGNRKEIQKEEDLGKQADRKSQNSFKENKQSDANTKNISTNVETVEKIHKVNILTRNEEYKAEKLKDTTTISNENIVDVSYIVDRNELIKAEVLDDNVGNKKKSNIIVTPHSSNKINTAIKEKAKKTKSNKLDAQYLSDALLEMEKPENIKKSDTKESRVTSEKTENEMLDLTNSFLCDKKEKAKGSKSKSNAEKEKQYDAPPIAKGESIKSDDDDKPGTRDVKKDNFKEKTIEHSCNADWIQPKKNEKSKGKNSFKKEQQTMGSEVSVKLELGLSAHENPILNDNKIKDVKSDSEALNAKNAYKDKPSKAKSDDKLFKKTIGNECLKSNENMFKEIDSGDVGKMIKTNDQDDKLNLLEIESIREKHRSEIGNSSEEKNETEEKVKAKATGKSESGEDTLNCKKHLCKDTAPVKMKQYKNNEDKTKSCPLPEMKNNGEDVSKTELSYSKPNTKTSANAINKNTVPLNAASPKKNGRGDIKKDDVLCKKICDQTIPDKENAEKKDWDDKKGNAKEHGKKPKSDSSEKELLETVLNACEKPNKVMKKLSSSPLPPTSAWKTLSGADMINKNLSKSDVEYNKIPILGTINKTNNSEKLLPEIPTPASIERQTKLDEFSVLKTLEPLPPLPSLEPLQLMTENNSTSLRDISLITFESPLLENQSAPPKITPPPRGFTEQNLILALCGSLHYENEHTEMSPTFSSNHSSAAFEDASLADFKSLTENDDPYMSLEQSSQDTNTANTNTTNEKYFSSTNSSGSEEIVIIEEKKITKKQKRKKQQQLKNLQTEKESNHQREIDDEELRPLIAMTDSQIDQPTNGSNEILPASVASFSEKTSLTTQSLLYSTTTDSEGPLPATTSDDNVFSIPVPVVHNPHKIKTKKLEHKINLIAAIEAATSSSTSSAEESGVELGCRSSHENVESLISEVNSTSTSLIQLPIVGTAQTTVGALKKKTKRRKR